METIHHFVFWILVICYHALSQEVTYKSCRNIASDEMCTALKMYCKRNDYLKLNCEKTCGTCKVAYAEPCRDLSSMCSGWKNAELCNMEYVQINCARTCGRCIQDIPVHGGYSQWSSWGPCNQTCGLGTRRRSRTCTNPPPANGGNCCCELGRDIEVRTCFIRKCPVDGNYSQWSNWSRCSRSCAGGAQYRSRPCTNPPPANGGRDCRRLGRATEFRKCNTYNCPVHGNYSQWSNWSQCSQTCAGGTQRRSRTCTSPQPTNGGRDCRGLGQAAVLRRCNTHKCPVDGGYTDWYPWSECSVTCGNGTQQRYRSCTNSPPVNNGTQCTGPAKGTRICTPKVCTKLIVTYLESCRDNSRWCTGWKDKYCKSSKYVQRICPRTCGRCIKGIPVVHGGYSQWSSWSPCSQTCGLGTRSRSRTCTSPPPANGGNDCSGLGRATEKLGCYMPRCPVCENSWEDSYCNKWSSQCGNVWDLRFRKNCKKTCNLC